MLLFSCVFSVLLALRLPRLGKRMLILVLFARLFEVRLFGFCVFPPPLGVWEGLRLVIVALPGLSSYLSCLTSKASLWFTGSLFPLNILRKYFQRLWVTYKSKQTSFFSGPKSSDGFISRRSMTPQGYQKWYIYSLNQMSHAAHKLLCNWTNKNSTRAFFRSSL